LKISNALDELEDYYFLEAYDGQSSVTYLSDLNNTVTLKCFVDLNTNMENYRYCYRSLNFMLYGYANSSGYTPIATMVLGDLSTYNTTLSVNITMPKDYTFAVVSPSSTSSGKNNHY
jgi:hypothetical protein